MRTKLGTSIETEMALRQIEVNGTKLGYVAQGNGEPVIFIHGEISDFRAWSEQLNLFSHYYKTVAYSRRHHYPNEPAGDFSDYSLSLHTADLLAFLKALNLEKVHLVGRSYGASVALLAALKHPELIRSLVLGEPSLFTDLLDTEGMQLLSKQKAGFNEVIRLIHRGRKEWAVRQFLNVIVGADVLDQFSGAVRTIVLENADTLEPALRTYYESPPVSCEQLKKLTVPTLLVSGEFSPRISRLSNERIKACLPNSELVILQGASHGLHMENPEGFNRIVLDFLANR